MSANTLTAVEQADLLRYAASLPEESGTRRAVLASLSRLAAGTEDDIRRHLPALKQGYEGYVQAIRDMEARAMPGDSDYARHAANRPWLVIINNGTKVVAGILSVRSIPDKGAKPLEMVYRLMNNSRRMPQDIYKWWNDNDDFFHEKQKRTKNFPTPYSATDAQEHFCDSLAMLAMGNLPDEFAVPFNAIWNP
jgi:hypothetical protein